MARKQNVESVKCDETTGFSQLRSICASSGGNLAKWTPKTDEHNYRACCRPELLLLDEPVSGLNSEEIDILMSLVKTVRMKEEQALLVEHNMKVVMDTCEQIVVINFGQKIAEGRQSKYLVIKKSLKHI